MQQKIFISLDARKAFEKNPIHLPGEIRDTRTKDKDMPKHNRANLQRAHIQYSQHQINGEKLKVIPL